MEIYKTDAPVISGSNASEVIRKVHLSFHKISSKTKRRPYVRSAFFYKEKIFLGPFLNHMFEKNWRDATQRLKLFDCAIDLIRHSKNKPDTMNDPHNTYIRLHRFCGITTNKTVFFVHIKEDRNSGNKTFISVYPQR